MTGPGWGTLDPRHAGSAPAADRPRGLRGAFVRRRLLAVGLTVPLLAAGLLLSFPGLRSTTAATPDARFIVFGDSGSGSAAQLALRDRMVTNAPAYDFALLSGDGAYPVGSTADYQAKFFGVYGGLFQGYATTPPAPTSGTPKPIWPTTGNHDWDTAGAAGYLGSFNLPINGPAGVPAELYYAWDVNGVHFVSFDSHYVVGWNMSTPQAQKDAIRDWLIADLDANTAKVTVLVAHHPAFTAGDHHGQSEETAMRSTWWPIFAGHGVDLVVNGHDHGYQRNAPQSGLTSYVSGGGGGALYPISPQSYTAASLSDYHYLQVSVTGCTITTAAVRTSGSEFDPWSYTAPTCNSTDPSPTGQLFADGFESGDLTAWTSAQVGTGGTATVQSSQVATGQYAARLSATSTTGSYAYLRKTLPAADTELTVTFAARIDQEGGAGANVPLLRLYNGSGTRLLSLYRQNQAGNKLYVQHSGAYNTTSGLLPLATWAAFDVRVIVAGTSSVVEIRQGGTLIHRTAAASLGSQGVSTIQVGNDTSGQLFSAAWDDVIVIHGAAGPIPTPTPSSAPPTPTPAPSTPPPSPSPVATPTPAPPTPTPGATLFSDTFESGTLSRWTTRTGGDGSATATAAAAATGSFGARLRASGTASSLAYIRAPLTDRQRLTITASVRVNVEGSVGGNVPLIRLFDGRGSRLVTVYRQNATSGRLYVQHGGVTYLASGQLPVTGWGTLVLVIRSGTYGDDVSLSLDGTPVYTSSGPAGLGASVVATVQFGNEVKKQAFELDVDDVTIVDE